ncbi:unnamed protein product [Trifolium pratense]|uniref:Uncharacterized protein n=1 Tax=Trifolium pratense TaxID=57577 RepID=A0ACB0JNL0_TRIPR|nr:unnamed protein product [Trifolium pratense]
MKCREEEESLGARAKGKARDSRSSSCFLRIQILQDFVVFDVESSVKLRSDCDTGKGVLYVYRVSLSRLFCIINKYII